MHSGHRTTRFRVFVRELRQREVLQTAGLYAVGAFLVTEIALAFIDRSPLSSSTQALAGCLLVSLFVAGFPVVIWLAWLFDITRHGIIREKAVARGRRVTAYAALATVVVATGLALWTLNPCGFGRVLGVAILPCSYHGAAEYDYQARGISAELNYRLSHLPQLQVPANSSVIHFSDRLIGPDELAVALGVSSLVECTMRRDQSRMTFELRLHRLNDDTRRWTGEYSGQAADELLLVADAFRELLGTDALGIEALAGIRAKRVNTPPTLSHEAWAAYQRARFIELEEDAEAALALYSKAAVVDPGFARAHAAAARLLWHAALLTDSGPGDESASFDAARAHINRALQAEHPGAESLLMQRVLLASQETAVELHDEIVKLRPGYAEEYYLWGAWLARQGRRDAAEAAYLKASILDPSGEVRRQYAAILPTPD